MGKVISIPRAVFEDRPVAAHFAAQMTRRPDQIARQAFQPIPPQVYHAEPVQARYERWLLLSLKSFSFAAVFMGGVVSGLYLALWRMM